MIVTPSSTMHARPSEALEARLGSYPLASSLHFLYTRTNLLSPEAPPMAGPNQVTPKQLAANRANAQRFAGPHSEGRTAARCCP